MQTGGSGARFGGRGRERRVKLETLDCAEVGGARQGKARQGGGWVEDLWAVGGGRKMWRAGEAVPMTRHATGERQHGRSSQRRGGEDDRREGKILKAWDGARVRLRDAPTVAEGPWAGQRAEANQ